MTGTKAMRYARAFNVAAIVMNVAIFALDLLSGRHALAFMPFVCIAALSVCVRMQTKSIRRREELDRPRPDYASIARMEREVWGRAFEHDGAPGMSVAELRATMDDLAERATARRNTCIGCDYPAAYSGRCAACYRRWKAGRDDDRRSNLRWN